MRENKEYKFGVSVSSDAYTDKIISNAMIGTTRDANNRRIRKEYGYKANKGVDYLEGEYTAQELLDKVTEGHVFCHLFYTEDRRVDGTFASTQKSNRNFRAAYIIGIDIDETKYKSAEEYIEKLEFKPTFYYTSYSNQQDGKGARFRMIYVFNEPITDPYHFRYYSLKLHSKIESDTGEKIKDRCGLNCSQYFNGTNRYNSNLVFSSGITNYIYEFTDFSLTKGDFLNFLKNNCYYKKKLTTVEKKDIENLIYWESEPTTVTTYYSEWEKNEHFQCLEDTKREVSDVDIIDQAQTDIWRNIEKKRKKCSEKLIADMSRLTYEEFMKYNRHRYYYFYRVEREDWIVFNDKVRYQEIDNSYFSLSYNAKRILDKQKRRKKLYIRMCLRRVMKPNVDADTLLFNAYEDLHRFCDNDSNTVGNVITIEELAKNVRWAMDKDIEDIISVH